MEAIKFIYCSSQFNDTILYCYAHDSKLYELKFLFDTGCDTITCSMKKNIIKKMGLKKNNNKLYDADFMIQDNNTKLEFAMINILALPIMPIEYDIVFGFTTMKSLFVQNKIVPFFFKPKYIHKYIPYNTDYCLYSIKINNLSLSLQLDTGTNISSHFLINKGTASKLLNNNELYLTDKTSTVQNFGTIKPVTHGILKKLEFICDNKITKFKNLKLIIIDENYNYEMIASHLFMKKLWKLEGYIPIAY